MKIIDRYLTKEMAFPFLIATFGFIIFIILNLILQLSDFLLARGISLWMMTQMLFYKLPELLVLALPVAFLFAVFLALGRLGHDREIIAFQAAGFSLKRAIVPILVCGILLSIFGLFLNEIITPWANHKYGNLIRQLALRRGIQIKDDTFFKDPEGRFFYVRRFYPNQNRLEGVLIHDMTSKFDITEGSQFPKVITAKEGIWEEEAWILKEGVIHKYDSEGNLEYKLNFEELTIKVDIVGGLLLEQRTPREMSLRELSGRIKTLKMSGLGAESLIVEYHSKISIPLAAFVFALFGAPLSLLFSFRGRAAGIIISVFLVSLFQGTLLWAQILGKRGVINPTISAWIPNIIFALLGVILLLLVDKVSKVDLAERLRRIVHFLSLLLFFSLSLLLPSDALAQTLDLWADSLVISEDGEVITALGNALVKYGENSIKANQMVIVADSNTWELQATEEVIFQGEEFSAKAQVLEAKFIKTKDEILTQKLELFDALIEYQGGRLFAKQIGLKTKEQLWEVRALGDVTLEEEGRITRAWEAVLHFEWVEDKLRAREAKLQEFSGSGRFENPRGEIHTIRYQGKKAQATFNEENEIDVLDISKGCFTTCECVERLRQEAYSIQADKVLIFPDLLVATNITLQVFGVPIFWSPFYLAPLKEEQERPFFPEIGRIKTRGWYVKWRYPFLIDEKNHGFLLIDYYTKFSELGLGLLLNYSFKKSSGKLYLYRLTGPFSKIEMDVIQRLELENAFLDLGVDFSNEGLGLISRLWGSKDGWHYQIGASREEKAPTDEEEPPYKILERLPEVLISNSKRIGPFIYSFGVGWGRYAEERFDGQKLSSSRFEGFFNLRVSEITFKDLKLSFNAGTRLSLYQRGRREVFEFTPSLSFSLGEINYTYRIIKGKTPFAFDSVSVMNKVDFNASWGLAKLATAYDFQEGLYEPLVMSFSLGGVGLKINYDLNESRLRNISLNVSMAREDFSGSAITGYDFVLGSFDDLVVKLTVGNLRIGLRYDLNYLWLERINTEVSFERGDWELLFKGEYDFMGRSFTAFQYGVIRKFCDGCWELGFYGSRGHIWVEARIGAFPSAEIKYSPTDKSIAFGD